TLLSPIFGEVHSHSIRCFLKRLYDAEVFSDVDAGLAKSRGHHGGHFFVLGRKNTRPGLKELDPRTEGVEDGSDLSARCSCADHYHRRRNGGQSPRVAVCGSQFCSRNGKRTA